jgi:hypothetical protein
MKNEVKTIKPTIWEVYTDKGGRPPKFKTAPELQRAIQSYFDLLTDYSGMKPTITGLTLYLGFMSRQSFYDMENITKFTYTVKRARMLIESVYEQLLHGSTPTGAIFALKNMGWDDKQTIDQTIVKETEVFKIGDQIITF